LKIQVFMKFALIGHGVHPAGLREKERRTILALAYPTAGVSLRKQAPEPKALFSMLPVHRIRFLRQDLWFGIESSRYLY